MSGAIQTEFPVLHIRWTVDTRKEQDSSSEFTFQGRQWRLYYYYRGEQRLALERMSEEDHPPFDVSVHIEGGARDRMVVRGLSWRGRFEAGTRFKLVWSKPESEVVRECPEFGRNNNHQLRFLVELKRRDVVRDSIETQTEEEIPEGFELPCMEGLSADFAQLLVQCPDPDVEFRCAGLSTPAHRTVVGPRSPVIASMLANDVVEGRTGVIVIPDMTPVIFRHFMRYIYTGKLPQLTFEGALSLYESGQNYAVQGLTRRCSRYLVEHLSDRTAFDVLVVADAHGDEGLFQEVVDWMLERRLPLTSDLWASFHTGHPRLAKKLLTIFSSLLGI